MKNNFILIYRDGKEFLFNLDTIWKMEVNYAMRDEESGKMFYTCLESAAKDTSEFRIYKIYFGVDTVLIRANPGDKVADAIEEIYKKAIKNVRKPPKTD